MDYKKYWWIYLFAVLLALFAIFSRKIGFHDSFEYITIAKNLAGIKNVAIFTTHPIVYPAFLAIFIKIWSSITIVKLVNVLWVFLIGLLVYLYSSDKRAFTIFAFSPLVWFVSTQTTPVLPAAFFFFLAYTLFKKDDSHNIKSILASGFFLGLSIAIYTPLLLVGFFFILSYFWNRNFSIFVKYFIMIIIGFLPTMILDFAIFHNPFYTFIRYAGTNALILLGHNQNISGFQLLSGLDFLLIFVVISPLLFRLHRLKFEENKKDLLFLIPVFLIFWIRAGLIEYFLIITPILIILLSQVLSHKEIKWHCILSIPLIIFLCWGHFATQENNINADLNKIIKDYNATFIVAGAPLEPHSLAVFRWKNSPEFIWKEDYLASKNNQTLLREYNFSFNPKKIKLNNVLVFSASFIRTDNINYSNEIVVTSNHNYTLESFKNDKCYENLCVYTP